MSKFEDAFGGAKISNIEDVLAKAKTVSESINKKSAKCLEISRKKVEYLDAKSKLAKSYERFGKLNFEILLGNEADEAEMDTLIAEITAYRERMGVLDKELDEAKSIFDTDDLKKEAEELKKEMKYASMETIEVLKIRAKEAMLAVQNAVDKAGSGNTEPVEVDAEPAEVDTDVDTEPAEADSSEE